MASIRIRKLKKYYCRVTVEIFPEWGNRYKEVFVGW